MAGLPGTGKSSLAKELAASLGAMVLDKDRVRAALFSEKEIEYSDDQDDLCMEVLYQAADFMLAKGRTVILDGRTFLRRGQVERLAEFAQEITTPLTIILCTCPEAVARQRLAADAETGTHPARNRGYSLYERLRAEAKPIPLPHIVIDTQQPLQKCLQDCLQSIRGDHYGE